MESLQSPKFGTELRRLRQVRGWSQMELSAEAEVSTRHLSFLETGRSHPSRTMVQRLGEALAVPYRAQNELLVAAGFAPLFGETALDDRRHRQMDAIRESLRFLLENHEPFPAFVLNRSWDIVMANRAHHRMLEASRAELGLVAEEPENALRLILAPDQLRPAVGNWPEVTRAVMMRLERQTRAAAGDSTLAALLDEMSSYPGVSEVLCEPWSEAEQRAIVVPIQFGLGTDRLSWFTTIASFGGAADITAQEIVIESLIPADEVTRRFAHELAAIPPDAPQEEYPVATL